MPKARTVGFIYNSSEVNSQLQIDLAKKAAAARGLKTVEATVSSVNDIQQAAQSLVARPMPVRAYGQCAGLRHAQPDQDHR
mgnify:CR=1 FL=1